jgi:hypothetical protein
MRLGADALATLREYMPGVFRCVATALVIVSLHNAPALVTRFGQFTRTQAKLGFAKNYLDGRKPPP